MYNVNMKRNSVFFSGLFQKKRTTEKLVEDSRADADFFVFLSAAIVITTLGLLINNPIVIVGAMLVAPILFPILALGMGVVTSSWGAIRRAGTTILKSVAVSVGISTLVAFLLRPDAFTEQLNLLVEPDLFVFFLTSFSAGIVASYSWAKQDTTFSLPGVAITVSLVPPLAAIGISLALLSSELLAGAVLLFIVNLLGIVLASVVIFSLFGYAEARNWQEQEIAEEKAAQEASQNAEPEPMADTSAEADERALRGNNANS